MEQHIVTYTGKRFSVLNPICESICLEDIAHSLSMLCRYNGHCAFFFSVAQHCIGVVNQLERNCYSSKILLYGLLHDAAEAYICDVPQPLKKLLPEYKTMETKIQAAVWNAFNLIQPSPEINIIIKEADRYMFFSETKVLMKEMNVEEYAFPNPDPNIRFIKPSTVERNFVKLGLKLIHDISKKV